MITVQLRTEEREYLIEVLESYLSDLRMEIADTDSSFFKDKLRGKKGVLNNILDSLSQSSEAA